MVYAREAGVEDGVDITQAEIRANSKQMIPFTGRWDDIQAMNEKMLGLDTVRYIYANRADAAVIDMFTGRIRNADLRLIQDLAAAADFTVANIASFAGDQITTHAHVTEGSATYAATALQTARLRMFVSARGQGVGNAILIPFALNGMPEMALDAPSLNKLELALTQGAAGATVRVSTRELVPA